MQTYERFFNIPLLRTTTNVEYDHSTRGKQSQNTTFNGFFNAYDHSIDVLYIYWLYAEYLVAPTEISRAFPSFE
jgi:hypothetical protein